MNKDKTTGVLLPKWKTAKEVEDLIEAYFKRCEEEKEPVLVTGLALSLDTNRMTLLNWDRQEYIDSDKNQSVSYNSVDPEERKKISRLIRQAKARIEHKNAVSLFKGEMHPNTGIFNLRANYKWVDRQEVDVTSGDEKLTTGQIQIIMPTKEDGAEE
jgi:hypothetical protein